MREDSHSALKNKTKHFDFFRSWTESERKTWGLFPHSERANSEISSVSLEEGRRLYEEYIGRPRVTGGLRESTKKRYRTVFDKFIAFAEPRGVTTWSGVTANVLNAYAAELEEKGYAHKSLVNELTVLKQTVKWLISAGHLKGVGPIELKLRKAESQRAYCYSRKEVAAIIAQCRKNRKINWLGDVVIALACTGLRISELASLQWSDVDLATSLLTLTDETGRSPTLGKKRRELKSGRSRSIPIYPDLRAVLERLPRKDQFVFRGPRGGRLKPSTVRHVLVREVISKLESKFPSPEGKQGFRDGRLHSFRHYFCSVCANDGVPERMVMDWLGHADSEMVRHYYHLHDEESKRRMNQVKFLGEAAGWSVGDKEEGNRREGTESHPDENRAKR